MLPESIMKITEKFSVKTHKKLSLKFKSRFNALKVKMTLNTYKYVNVT